MLMKRMPAIGISGIVVVIIAWLYLRPALMSEATIRASLLAQTQLGSSMDDVRALAEKNGWIEPGVKLTSYEAFGTGTGIVVNAFSGRLKHDPFPYRTEVGATWEFDPSNHLVNINVNRYGFE